jgi:hypothetical protein
VIRKKRVAGCRVEDAPGDVKITIGAMVNPGG